MFVILLKFSDNKSNAAQWMGAHKEWINQGFNDQVFVLVGSIQPAAGGAILAQNTSKSALLERVNADPFVAQDIVTAEIIEISPSRTNEHLTSLLAAQV